MMIMYMMYIKMFKKKDDVVPNISKIPQNDQPLAQWYPLRARHIPTFHSVGGQ